MKMQNILLAYRLIVKLEKKRWINVYNCGLIKMLFKIIYFDTVLNWSTTKGVLELENTSLTINEGSNDTMYMKDSSKIMVTIITLMIKETNLMVKSKSPAVRLKGFEYWCEHLNKYVTLSQSFY